MLTVFNRYRRQQHLTILVSAIIDVTEEAITVSLKQHSADALPTNKPAPFGSFHL